MSSWRLDGREFHAFGPENEKLRSPNFSFNRGSSYRKLLEDLSLSRPGRSATDVIMSDRYAGLYIYTVYVSSPSGVWGRAPAANDLAAFWTEMEASGAMILSSVMDFINGM